MAQRNDIWFPLFVRDFLTSETVQLLSNEEVGIFVKLLCHQWIEGSIPADPQALARIVGWDGEPRVSVEFPWDTVQRLFSERTGDGGRLVNPRLRHVREEQDAKHQERVESGRRGGRHSRADNPLNRLPDRTGGKLRLSSAQAELKHTDTEADTEGTTYPLTPLMGGTGPHPSKGKHPCPDPFPITDSMRTWFHERVGTEVPGSVIETQHESFLDWVRSRRPRCADWEAAWRNFMLRAARDFRTPLGDYRRENRAAPPPLIGPVGRDVPGVFAD